MTRTRALLGALAAGSLSLGLAGTASAQFVNNITGTNSVQSFSCLGLLVAVFQPDCTYDGTAFNDAFPVAGFTGPIPLAGFYQTGQSPWGNPPVPSADASVPGDPAGDPKYNVPLLGTVTVDNKGTPCDADDTIAADIAYGEAVRNFAGGQGDRGEESWQDGDLSFELPETVVSSATPNAGGCDYVIGSAGAPQLLTTQLTGAVYGDDVNIIQNTPSAGPPIDDVWNVNDGTDYQGNQPTISGVERNPNVGAPMIVTNGPTYQCSYFDSGVPGLCPGQGAHHNIVDPLIPAGPPNPGGQTPPNEDDPNGDRAHIENSIWVVSTNAGGDITSAQVYPIHERLIATFAQPEWDGPLWTFTGICASCGKSVNDDSASVLEGDSVDISVLANDSGLVDPVTVVIDTPPAAGTANVINSPGPQANVTITYDATGVAPGQQTFVYDVTDSEGPVGTATVTVTVEADRNPVAPDAAAPGIDTTGVAPESQTSVIDVALIPGVDLGNVPSTVAITAQGTLGNAAVAGTVITYTPDPASFVGNDTYTYSITDDQGDTDTGDITVAYANSLPVAGDGTADTDANVDVDVDLLPLITPGNGEVSDHVLTVTAETDGTAVLNGTVVTFTPDAGFVGAGTFTYTLDDGNLDQDTGVVTITVNAAAAAPNVVKLPGGSSALGPLSLLLLLGLPLLRRRRRG